jgi:HAD superfamily hydrolase (TIGR01549 family)
MEQLGLEPYERDLSDIYFATTKALRHEVTMIDGARDLLSNLKEHGYSVSIITSKPRMNAELVVEQMAFEVDLLVCGDDYIRGKPDPIAGRDIFKNFDVKSAEVLYVGDMIFDFQFALNSGMEFVFFADKGQNHLPKNLCNTINEIDELRILTDILSVE